MVKDSTLIKQLIYHQENYLCIDSDKDTSTRGYSTTASASAFQAEDVGSIPITRSGSDLIVTKTTLVGM